MFKQWLRGVFRLVGSIFPKPQTPRKYLIIEVEKGVPIKADDSAIATLKDHPGFVALVNRMKLKQAYLNAQLLNNRHGDIREVDSLQLALYWTRFLESEVNAAIGNVKAKAPVVYASDQVTEEFERVKAALEAVGSQDNAN